MTNIAVMASCWWLKLLSFVVLLVVTVEATDSTSHILHPWDAWQVRKLLCGSSRVREISSRLNVPESRFAEVAGLVGAHASLSQPQLQLQQYGRLVWFERNFVDVSYKDQGVLLMSRSGMQLLEFNVTLPAEWKVVSVKPFKRTTELSAISFNIRYGSANDGLNSWPYRENLVYDLLKKYNADLVGAQEALKFQIDDILANVPGYSYIGVGRDDGLEAGEYSPIFYKPDRYFVAESGTFWFCNTPTIPGCKDDYGNGLPRIATWGRFVDRTTQYNFFYYNLHLDNASEQSRLLSVQQLLADITRRVGSSTLVLVTGDFNAGEDEQAIQLMRSGGFVDTFRVLYPNATNVGTFNSFNGDSSGPKIDYVWGSNSNTVGGFVEVLDAAIIQDNTNGRYPSDHFPVSARVFFP